MWVHPRAFRASLVTVRIQYSLFLVSSWECSEIGLSLSIGWITFVMSPWVVFFHSTSLSCFLPRAFVFLSWLDVPLHFVVTYLMLQDMFIDHDHLVFALYTYHVPDTSFFVWSLIQFSTRRSYVHYRKVKGMFLHPYFFERFALITLSFFLSWSSSRRLIQGYVVTDGVSISWQCCFSHLIHFFGSLIEIL